MEGKTFGELATPVVPGISWTAPEKSRAWLQPTKEVDVATIAQLYIAVLAAPEAANDVLDALETKTPIATIAETFMLVGVSKGLHTIDAGILVMPVIMETLKTIADMNDIDTVMFPSELEKDITIHPRIIRKMTEEIMAGETEVVEEAMPMEEPAPMGLMSRKKKEGV